MSFRLVERLTERERESVISGVWLCAVYRDTGKRQEQRSYRDEQKTREKKELVLPVFFFLCVE